MARVLTVLSLVLAIAIIGINASPLQTKDGQKVDVRVVTKEKMDKLLEKYPNAVPLVGNLVKPEATSAAVSPRVIFEYTLGYRVAGDGVVAHDTQSHTWLSNRDVEMTLEYPSQGVGAIVTYVNIRVGQSSLSGRAYVVNGGIGYRYITIIVEAENTYFFDHDAYIYGIP